MSALSRFTSPLQRLYAEGEISALRAKSLRYLMFGSVLGTVFTTITSSGTMLTGYFSELGGSALLFGLLSAIPFLAAILQIPASICISRAGSRKKYRIRYGTLARVLWVFIGLIPLFLPANPFWLRIAALCVLRGLSAGYEAFPEVTYSPWLADLVPQKIRGRWLSIRDILCNIVSISLGLLLVLLLEWLPGLTGYILIFVAGGLIGVADILCYLRVEDTAPPAEPMQNLLPVAKQLVHDQPFFHFMLFWAFWLFTAYLANPYTNYYALNRLGLSMSITTIHGQVIPSVVSILVAPFWGSLIDRLGNKRVMFLSCTLAALAPMILVFSSTGSAFSFFLYNLLGSAVWSVPFLVSLNMMLCNSPRAQRTSYVAIFHAGRRSRSNLASSLATSTPALPPAAFPLRVR